MRNERFEIEVDGVAIPCPSKYQWGYHRINAAESGRTDDTIMHANQVGKKRKLQLEWSAMDPETTSTILKAFEPEYIMVKYFDFMENQWQTRKFYTGADMEAGLKMWVVGNQIIETVSFNIIEV